MMSTQQFTLKNQAPSDNANGFAIVFFLLGAPHIYSFLRRRSRSKNNFSIAQKTIRAVTILAGTLTLLNV
jgi:hypothetical protein